MKRKGRTTNLKQRVLAVAFSCLCIFVYSEQITALGSDATQVVIGPDKCCKSCGSVGYCLLGAEFFNVNFSSGWEHCVLILEPTTGEVIGCKVSGEYCGCSSDA